MVISALQCFTIPDVLQYACTILTNRNHMLAINSSVVMH